MNSFRFLQSHFLVSICVIFVYSCSHTPSKLENERFISYTKGKEFVTLNSYLNSMCLSGVGSGKFSFIKESSRFSFESLFQKELRKWAFAISFPLRGEELLEITWKSWPNGPTHLGGPFYHYLRSELHKSSDQGKDSLFNLKVLLNQLGEILNYVKDVNRRQSLENMCQLDTKKMAKDTEVIQGSCFNEQYFSEVMKWKMKKGHLRLYYKDLILTLSQLKDDCFHYLSFNMKGEKEKQAKIKLQLDYKSCSSESKSMVKN